MVGEPFIHETAVVEDGVELGGGTKVWHHAHLRAGAVLGADCNLGKSVYLDSGVVVGDRVKIQNHVSLYRGVVIGDDVMIGPAACFTNDLRPRATDDWEVTETRVGNGVGIGANSTIVCGATIGDWAMVGAGTVVVGDVPAHALVVGNPSRIIGWVDRAGNTVHRGEEPPEDRSILDSA
ncbi:MAG: acyltransferase [Actinomycetota bacterium]